MRVAILLVAGLLASALAGCGSVPPQSDADARRERQSDVGERAQRAIGRGEVGRAAGYYREALRIAEATEDFPAIGVYALNLAATYQALDETVLAQGALEKVLAEPARFERALVVEAAGRRALLALQARQLDTAEEWLGRAERDCVPASCKVQVALQNLRGQLLLEGGNAAAARTAMIPALAGARAEGNQEEEANALRVDGRAAARLGEHGAAVTALNRALALDKQLGLPRKIALDLIELAEVEIARGERAAAREYAQRALAVSRAAGSKRQQDEAQRLLVSIP
jgi:tetratricopeptide (TPR) repeat protein